MENVKEILANESYQQRIEAKSKDLHNQWADKETEVALE